MTGTNRKRGATSNLDANMPQNLRKTPHGYTYLKTVPHDLKKALGKTVIKKALGRKFSDAKIQAAELEAETVALFQRLREQEVSEQSADDAIDMYLKKPAATRLTSLDAGRPGLSSQLASLYLQSLKADSTARSNGERWFSADEPNSLTGELQVVLETIKKAVVTGDVTSFFPVIELLTEWRGYRLVDNSGDDLQRLTYDFLRAAQQAVACC